ncbi:MAG TPA: hypothetical protein VGH96_16515 [Streptosporangiaceae bacterium]
MTPQWTTPGQRWRLLAPAGAAVVDLPSWPLAVRRTAERLRALPEGSPVILLDHRPGSRRTRRVALASALTVDREYVALPSLRAAIVLVEDSRDSLRWACQSVVAPPPGSTWAHGPLHAAVALLRRYPGLAARLAAGRVVVGRTA